MMGTANDAPRGISENRRTPSLAGPAQSHFFAPTESDTPMFSHTRQVASRDGAEVATQNASAPALAILLLSLPDTSCWSSLLFCRCGCSIRSFVLCGCGGDEYLVLEGPFVP